MAELQAYLAPAARDRLALRVAALLANWYVPDLPVPAHALLLDGWVGALGQYPEWSVVAAIQDWLDTVEEKPTPAALARRCRRLVDRPRLDLIGLQQLLAAPPTTAGMGAEPQVAAGDAIAILRQTAARLRLPAPVAAQPAPRRRSRAEIDAELAAWPKIPVPGGADFAEGEWEGTP